jgi:hypothetical protein
VARNRLAQAARRLGVQLEIVDEMTDADVLVTLKSYYRKRRQLIREAEHRRTPVYVLRANTVNQMENFLVRALDLEAVPPTLLRRPLPRPNRPFSRCGRPVPN